jgi:RHS repeat-associated protein
MQTTAAGNSQESCTSNPYGDGLSCTGGVDATEQHFTGKDHDAESGLDYFYARYYSETLGRFMTPDWAAAPAAVPYASYGDPQSLNLYAYVQNNPLTGIDATGHYNNGEPDSYDDSGDVIAGEEENESWSEMGMTTESYAAGGSSAADSSTQTGPNLSACGGNAVCESTVWNDYWSKIFSSPVPCEGPGPCNPWETEWDQVMAMLNAGNTQYASQQSDSWDQQMDLAFYNLSLEGDGNFAKFADATQANMGGILPGPLQTIYLNGSKERAPSAGVLSSILEPAVYGTPSGANFNAGETLASPPLPSRIPTAPSPAPHFTKPPSGGLCGDPRLPGCKMW